MRRWQKLSLASAVLVAAACSETPSAPQQSQVSFSAAHPAFNDLFQSPGEHVHILPTRDAFAGPLAANGVKSGSGGSTGTGIYYHGGPIILLPQIAAIYWSSSSLPIYNGGPAAGTFGAGSGDGSLVGTFMRSLGGSGYWNINSTYTGSGGQVGGLTYAAYWADNTNAPAPGASVSDAAVQAEVVNGFTSGKLAYSSSTLYAVFSANGVNLGGGAGTQYCAYHGHFTWTSSGNNYDVKYAVMPYDYGYGSSCSVSGASPTSDPAAAAEVNTLAHEAEETATDEDLNAWYDRRGYENADKCAWNFGATSSGATGTYNQSFGKDVAGNPLYWLIQMNWVNAGSGGCVQKW